MRKTIFLSDAKISDYPTHKFECPYIFFDRTKWRQDTLYFQSVQDLKKIAKKTGFSIK